jgi:hypothetical protein
MTHRSVLIAEVRALSAVRCNLGQRRSARAVSDHFAENQDEPDFMKGTIGLPPEAQGSDVYPE